jgi:hypothetical protein
MAHPTFDPYFPPMSLHYLLANGESKTETGKSLAVLLYSMVRLKNPFLLFWR